MRDQHQGDSLLAARFADQFHDMLLVGTVDVRRGLVGQDQRRTVGQCPGYGDALLLAHRQGRRLVAGPLGQAHAFDQPLGTAPVLASAGKSHSEHHVFQSGKAGQQIEGLEDVSDARGAKAVPRRFGQLGDVDAIDADHARVGAADAGDHVQQRGFAAAAGPDQHHLLAAVHGEPRHVQDR